MSGKAYAGALGLVALVLFLAGGLFGLKGTGGSPIAIDAPSLVLLVFAGLVLDVLSNPLAHYGYVCLGFFTAFYTLARPSDLVGQGEFNWLAALGQALLVAGLGMIPRLASIGQSWTHVFSYFGVNMLRLVVAGLPFLLIRGTNPFFSYQTLAATAVAIVLYLVFDATIVGVVTNEVEEAAEQRIWNHVVKRARFVLVGPLPLALMAVAFSWGFKEMIPLPVAVLAGVALGGLCNLAVRSALRWAAEELVVQDIEQLELALRTSQHHEKRLKEDNQAVTEELKAKQTELDLINEMARELGASTTLAETLSTVQKMIRRHRIPYQSCVIFLLKDRETMLLYPALADTPYKEVLEMSPLLQLQEQLITQVMQEQRSQMVGEMSASSEQRIFKDERSVVCVPLTVTKEIVGVIYLGSINAKTHKEDHLEKLKMLATFAAPSIKTAVSFENKEQDLRSERQMREAVEAQKKLLEGLQKMGQDLGQTLKINNMLQTVVENLKRMLPQAQSVIVFTLGPDDPHALRTETSGAHSPYIEFVKTLPIRNDEGLVGKATELKSTLLVKDTAVYDLQNIIAYERSVIVAPLVAENSVLGCLYVGATKEGSFNEEHRSLVETVSYQAAIAIKNALLYEQTQQMALTDGLTGLYTHRHFQVRLSEEIEWSERSGKPIVLVMVDTDHFKSFNDNLGHPAGDALLKEIASLLKDKVRSTDIVCRYGGDEFALILRDAPKDQAMMTCERIRESFQLRFAGHAVQVTSSIGMACFPSDARNKKDLAKAADDAMYVSKRNGRNKVTAAPSLEDKSRPGYVEVVQEVIGR